MAMGATMLFFEVRDLDFVESCGFYTGEDTTKTEIFDLSEKDLNIVIDGNSKGYQLRYDDTLENKAKVVLDSVDYKTSNHSLYIDDFNYEIHHNYGFNDGIDVFHRLIEGFKEGKVYTCNNYSEVVVYIAKENKDKVHVSYD